VPVPVPESDPDGDWSYPVYDAALR
jgi:hypothetical protein